MCSQRKTNLLVSSAQILIIFLIMFLLLLPTAAFSNPDSVITGVITKQGFGYIIVKDSSGIEIKLNTGRETNYEPADYRCEIGDTITANYYKKVSRDGRSSLLAVKKITLVKADPNRKILKSPATGTIEKTGRKCFRVSIPAVNKTMKFERIRGTKTSPDGWIPRDGQKVVIDFEKKPARWGKSYVYVIKSMKLVR
ncbi:MAG: hypothetical protein C4B58_06530 [Deltaproteobacteria bacterium]|nr:MAG: hypothetical protein C4B58_06530 [Deltaproteobacteria bacterium]